MPKRIYDWNAVQEFHDRGHGFVECRKRFGFSHWLWTKAISTGLLHTTPSRFEDARRKHDWSEIQAYYDEGHSSRACQLKFGFCAAAWHKAVKRCEITTRSNQRMSIEALLIGRRCRTHVKTRLLRAGLLENRCSECGLAEWRGMPLKAHIDHINGIKNDNRLENLRMLCPNCHSQTNTYGGRNLRRLRALQEPPEAV